MTKQASTLPAPLLRGIRQFEDWRSNRATPRIPDELWSLAVDLAGRYGLNRTARALRLQYYDLKKRLTAPGESRGGEDVGLSPTFVEIPSVAYTTPSECLVEFENTNGAKMRIQVKGSGNLDLQGLSRLFLGVSR